MALLAVFLPFHVIEVELGVPTKNFANWAVDLDIWAQPPLLKQALELNRLNNSNFLHRRAAVAAKSQQRPTAKSQPPW